MRNAKRQAEGTKAQSQKRNTMRAPRLLCLMFISTVIALTSLVDAEIGWHASGKNGAVAAGKKESVAAGISILEKGGNAADAAAALFSLSV